MHNEICTWLNMQMLERPDFMLAVLRTLWSLDPADVPADIEAYSTSSSICHANILGLINGMINHTGYRITTVEIGGGIQFITEAIQNG